MTGLDQFFILHNVQFEPYMLHNTFVLPDKAVAFIVYFWTLVLVLYQFDIYIYPYKLVLHQFDIYIYPYKLVFLLTKYYFQSN